MANKIIPLQAPYACIPLESELLRRAGLRSFISSKSDPSFVAFGGSSGGLLTLRSSQANIYSNIGVAMDLPENNFEVLLKFTLLSIGSAPFVGTGLNIYLSSNKNVAGAVDGYQVGFGSAGSYSSLTIIKRDSAGASTILSNSNPSNPLVSGKPHFLRVRRSGNSLLAKSWPADMAEPSSWSTSINNPDIKTRHVYIQTYSHEYGALVQELAIATGGDSATLSSPPVAIATGFIVEPGVSKTVVLYDYETNIPVYTTATDATTGAWSCPVFSDRRLYARVENSTETDMSLLFTQGEGWLGGSPPEGGARVEGVPSPAVIRVLLRTEEGNPLDGFVIAEVATGRDGSWRVDSLDPSLKFDVVCRYAGYNDMILSNVSPTPY